MNPRTDRQTVEAKIRALVQELRATGLRSNASPENTRATIERLWPALPQGLVTQVVFAATGGNHDGRKRPIGRPRGS